MIYWDTTNHALWLNNDNLNGWTRIGGAGGSGGGIVHYDYVVDTNVTTDGETYTGAPGWTAIGYNDIQAAVTAIDAENAARSLLINAGTYAENVTIPGTLGSGNDLWIHGEARRRVLWGNASTGTALTIEGPDVGELHFRNINFRGATSGYSVNSSLGDQVKGHFEDCEFDRKVNGDFEDAYFRRCDFNAGYQVDASFDPDNVWFHQCKMDGTSTWAGTTNDHYFHQCIWSGGTDLVSLTGHGTTIIFDDCDMGGTAKTFFTSNGATKNIGNIVFDNCDLPPPSTANGVLYFQDCNSCTGVRIINSNFQRTAASTNPYITSASANFKEFTICGNTFGIASGAYVEDSGGYSVKGIFKKSVIGPNTPDTFGVQLDAGSADCIIITNGTVDIASGVTGITVCGTGSITGAGALGATRAIVEQASGVPSHTKGEGVLYWDNTNHNLYVSLGGGSWQHVGGATALSPGTIVVQEDDSTVDAAVTTLDFTEPDGTLVTSSPAGEANIAMNLYAKLAGRSGGQTLIGGTGSGDSLNLQSSSHATKGRVNVTSNNIELFVDTIINLDAATPTISGGSLAVTKSNNQIQGEGASDDILDYITLPTGAPGGGELLLLRSGGQNITVNHNAGGANSIQLADATDLVLDSGGLGFLLVQRYVTVWVEVCRGPTLITHAGLVGVTANQHHNQAHGTSDHTSNGNWKVFYTDGSGDQIELALGADGTFLQANGTSSAPTFAALVASDIPGTTRSITLTAAAGQPTTTAGCAALAKTEAGTNDVDYSTLDFDTATDEFAFWGPFPMPDNYDGGTLTMTPYWTAASGSGTVAWACSMASRANDEAIDQAWGTAVTSTDTLLAAGDVHVGPTTTAITPAGTPAAGELMFVRIMRDVSEDSLGVDARLIAIRLEYTTSSYSE